MDYQDVTLAGKPFKPSGDAMVMMNSSGVFFLYSNNGFYQYVKRLSDVLYKYDVKWSD